MFLLQPPPLWPAILTWDAQHGRRYGNCLSVAKQHDDHVHLNRKLLVTMIEIRIAMMTTMFVTRRIETDLKGLGWERESPHTDTHAHTCVYTYLPGFGIITDSDSIIIPAKAVRVKEGDWLVKLFVYRVWAKNMLCWAFKISSVCFCFYSFNQFICTCQTSFPNTAAFK